VVSVSQLNQLASIATEAPDELRYEQWLFDCLERIVGFDVAFFKRPSGPGAVVRGVDADWLARGERSLWDCSHEIRAVVEAAREQSGVAIDLDVLGRRGLERTQYYQRLMRPIGGHSTALLPMDCMGRCLSTLVFGLCRAPRPRETELLEQIAPTLRLCEATRHAHVRRRDAPSPDQHSLPESLTPAEREVLSFLRLGYTNAEIAQARGNAARTVRNQLSSAYAKLGVASRAEAVAALSLPPSVRHPAKA
jgi:DNA-binding CsgD family transcriptional regulator